MDEFENFALIVGVVGLAWFTEVVLTMAFQ